jgi:hypothetical protein
MKAKLRCPGCGAKNEVGVRRCRVCTFVIDANAPEQAPPEPVLQPEPPSALGDHFDAGVIDRQLQPARSRFAGSSGLSSRLAGAQGNREAPTDATPVEPAATDTAWPTPRRVPPPDPDHFDPDALFRDMD